MSRLAPPEIDYVFGFAGPYLVRTLWRRTVVGPSSASALVVDSHRGLVPIGSGRWHPWSLFGSMVPLGGQVVVQKVALEISTFGLLVI